MWLSNIYEEIRLSGLSSLTLANKAPGRLYKENEHAHTCLFGGFFVCFCLIQSENSLMRAENASAVSGNLGPQIGDLSNSPLVSLLISRVVLLVHFILGANVT